MEQSHENVVYLNQSAGAYDIDPYLEFDNPVRDSGVETIGKPERSRYATYHEHRVTMEDGAKYLVTASMVNDKYQRDSSDIMNLETTAWLTQRDGMNKRRMAVLARLGMPTVYISVQQNRSRFGDLTKNAHNGLEIAKTMAAKYDLDSRYITTQGVSRGAMTAMAEASIAPQHKMEVKYTDAIVPCLPEGLHLKDLTEFLRLPYNELSTIRALAEIPLKYLVRYPKTLDLNFLQQLKEIPTLTSGAVGRQVRRNMNPDTFMHATVYKGDILSQGKRWQDLFSEEDYPNVVLDIKNGGSHISSVGNDCFGAWEDRARTITDILHEDPARRSLGATALRLLAAERSPTFKQPAEYYQDLLAS